MRKRIIALAAACLIVTTMFTGNWSVMVAFADDPVQEAPAGNIVTEEAVTEEAVTEEAVTEEPVTEEAVTEEAVAEEPVTEEPVAEEAVAEEAVAEEPVTEEAVAEEAVTEEPVTEEPVTEEAVAEEAVTEEPVTEEPVTEEPVTEEPVAEEAVAEEPVAEEPVAEEPAKPIDSAAVETVEETEVPLGAGIENATALALVPAMLLTVGEAEAQNTEQTAEELTAAMIPAQIIRNGEWTAVTDDGGKAVTDADGRQLFHTGISGIDCYLSVADFAGSGAEGLDYVFDDDGYIRSVTLHYVIGDSVSGDTVLPISEGILQAINMYSQMPENGGRLYPLMPGDTMQFNFDVQTADGNHHTYQYKDTSLALSSADMSDAVEAGKGSKAVSYEGQEIAWNYIGALASSQPIQKLLGVNSSTLKAHPELVLNIYSVLKGRGYEGENALTNYMLNYYNEKYHTSYDSITELFADNPGSITNMQGGMSNAQYIVSEEKMAQLKKDYAAEFSKGYVKEVQNTNGTYTLQFKWPESELAAASYNNFYENLLNLYFGNDQTRAQFQNYMNTPGGTGYGVADYRDSELYTRANEYFKSLGQIGITGEDAVGITFQILMGLNGPSMNNAYQMYEYSFGTQITLEQVDGGISVDKVDTDGNRIISSETGYNLYYMTVENDENVTYYYKITDGVVTFTTDKNEASVLMTTQGNLNIQYLLPNTYYLAEIIAPDGYSINTEALQILVEKGLITEASFTDTAITVPGPTPTPVPTPTPAVTVTTAADVTPVATPAVLGARRTAPATVAAIPVTEKPAVLGAERDRATGDTTDDTMRILLMITALAGMGITGALKGRIGKKGIVFFR